jgi:hypothetical protein
VCRHYSRYIMALLFSLLVRGLCMKAAIRGEIYCRSRRIKGASNYFEKLKSALLLS